MEAFYLDLQYIIDIFPFENKQDFENYIARLQARPVQVTIYHRGNVNNLPYMGPKFSVRVCPDVFGSNSICCYLTPELTNQ
jgi:hypothetical protein